MTHPARSLALVCPALALGAATTLLGPPALAGDEAPPVAALQVADGEGRVVSLPLEHTEVRGEVSGFVARVEVVQTYGNPYEEPIEATYVFPLPERAAVDDFEMEVGPRRVRGEIRRREEARRIYEQARSSGFTASLLEQERPNVFTQSVANILPGHTIRVRLRYVDLLPYEAGSFRFLFPMVVGPRYFPGARRAAGTQPPQDAATPAAPRRAAADAVGDAGTADRAATDAGTGPGPWPAAPAGGAVQPPAPPTDVVPDADRINPPVLRPGFRSGQDISLTLDVETAVPLGGVTSESHRIVVERLGDRRARVSLAAGDRIPNKDFMLRIQVAAELPEVGVIAHRSDSDGFFALRLQPKASIAAAEAVPKEILFVLDQSGSMSGRPIEMSKRFMERALETLGPDDSFNIIRFASGTEALSPRPLPSDEATVALGLRTVRSMRANGGTELLAGLREALRQPHDPRRLRIVFFLSDGFIGDEERIFDAIRREAGDARVFTLGIGSSVNHYLLREMAALGRGAYQYIRPDGHEEEAIERFRAWVTLPYLTDLEIDWGGLQVEDLHPARLPDLFSGQTLTVVGRYLWPGDETIIVRGRLGGRPWETQVPVHLPDREASHAALASVWARERIRELLLGDGSRPEIEYQVTSLALSFRLLSPFTSFVAVDESEVVNPDDRPRPVAQALPLPEFVSFEGCFGPEGPPAVHPPPPPPPSGVEEAAGAVRVEVQDERGPARGASVLLRSGATGEIADRSTGDDGTARFDGLVPGAGYRLLALYRGRAFASNAFEVEPGAAVEVAVWAVAAPPPPSPEPALAPASPRPERASAAAPAPPRPLAPSAPDGGGAMRPAAPSKAGGSPPGSSQGGVVGSVVDKDGNPMSGVIVTAGSVAAGDPPATAMTDAGGRYTLTSLAPAPDYDLTAELPGFARVVCGPVRVEAGATTTQNLSLVPATELTQRVTVSAVGDLVDAASSATGAVFGGGSAAGAPVAGRTYQDILTLAPGVTESVNGPGSGEAGGVPGGVPGGVVGGVVGGVAGGVAGQVDASAGPFAGNLDLESIAGIEVVMSGASAASSSAAGGFAPVASERKRGPGGADHATAALVDAAVASDGAGALVEPALRVLADLASDHRLSPAEGVPALAGLLAAQDARGRLGASLAEHALATWALAEASRAYPDVPWLARASEAAAGELRAAAYEDDEWPALRGGAVDPFTTTLARLALRAGGITVRADAARDPDAIARGLTALAGASRGHLVERVVEGVEDGSLAR